MVDDARILHGVRDRLLGDGVEHHALDRMGLDRVLLLERFEHVPGDRLAFAVRVGGEDQLAGTFERAGDVGQALCRLWIDLPQHAEVGRGIDRAVLGRQVAHVAERRQHLVARAKILVDGLGFGRRFNDDNVHGNPVLGEPANGTSGFPGRPNWAGTWVS